MLATQKMKYFSSFKGRECFGCQNVTVSQYYCSSQFDKWTNVNISNPDTKYFHLGIAGQDAITVLKSN